MPATTPYGNGPGNVPGPPAAGPGAPGAAGPPAPSAAWPTLISGESPVPASGAGQDRLPYQPPETRDFDLPGVAPSNASRGNELGLGAAQAPPPQSIHRDLGLWFGEEKSAVLSDYSHFYSWDTLIPLATGFGIAAGFANSPLDQNIRNWYQTRIRTSGTDQVAKVWKNFGEGGIMIPAMVGMDLIGNYFDDQPIMAAIGSYGDEVARAYLVGGPAMLAGQYLTGGRRPSQGFSNGSYWEPFAASNGVSGHAFISSIPFITAADMVENPFLKGGLYFCSTVTAWSRVNDDAHYFSQACLGWWMGYLSVRAVEQSDADRSRFRMEPFAGENYNGVGFAYRY